MTGTAQHKILAPTGTEAESEAVATSMRKIVNWEEDKSFNAVEAGFHPFLYKLCSEGPGRIKYDGLTEGKLLNCECSTVRRIRGMSGSTGRMLLKGSKLPVLQSWASFKKVSWSVGIGTENERRRDSPSSDFQKKAGCLARRS